MMLKRIFAILRERTPLDFFESKNEDKIMMKIFECKISRELWRLEMRKIFFLLFLFLIANISETDGKFRACRVPYNIPKL